MSTTKENLQRLIDIQDEVEKLQAEQASIWATLGIHVHPDRGPTVATAAPVASTEVLRAIKDAGSKGVHIRRLMSLCGPGAVQVAQELEKAGKVKNRTKGKPGAPIYVAGK